MCILVRLSLGSQWRSSGRTLLLKRRRDRNLRLCFLLVLVTLDIRQNYLTETRTSSTLGKRAEKLSMRIHVLDPLHKTPLLCFALTEREKKTHSFVFFLFVLSVKSYVLAHKLVLHTQHFPGLHRETSSIARAEQRFMGNCGMERCMQCTTRSGATPVS